MRKVAAVAAITFVLAEGVALAATASADEEFIGCPDGQSGVATTVTSCAFAENVRRAYFSQGGPIVTAYSPVTGEVYDMQCQPGFIAHLVGGDTVASVRCVGGNDAVVIVW
jgi:hypothetical protein